MVEINNKDKDEIKKLIDFRLDSYTSPTIRQYTEIRKLIKLAISLNLGTEYVKEIKNRFYYLLKV